MSARVLVALAPVIDRQHLSEWSRILQISGHEMAVADTNICIAAGRETHDATKRESTMRERWHQNRK